MATRKRLNNKLVRALKPKAKRYYVYDNIVTEFCVRVGVVNKGGTYPLTYGIVKRRPGRPTASFLQIGDAQVWTDGAARDRAREMLGQIDTKIDPREHDEQREEEAAQERAQTFNSVADQYIAKRQAAKRRGARTARTIERELCSVLGERPITAISKAEMRKLLIAIAEDRKVVAQARSTFRIAKALFRWTVARGILEHSPLESLTVTDLFEPATARVRLLSGAELKALWWACENHSSEVFGKFIKLALLTAARREELAGATVAEVDEQTRLWSIHPSRQKSAAHHVVPLGTLALEVMQSLPKPTRKPQYLFSTTSGERPISGFSKFKSELDSLMRQKVRMPIEPWVIHDLRRVVKTNLSRLGVNDIVSELILGHARKGIQGVYDRHTFLDERRAALDLWAKHLSSVIGLHTQR